MSKVKFQAAKELIQEERYDEARAILRTIDHPTAAEWLQKLDNIAPPPSAIKPAQVTIESAPSYTALGVPLNTVCPKCENQHQQSCDPAESNYLFDCPRCGTRFATALVKIRAKRARGNKRENSRVFSVRVIQASGMERLIEFARAGYEDFELRARDLAVFSFLDGKVRVVQNLTTGQYMTVKDPGCVFLLVAAIFLLSSFGVLASHIKI